MTDKSNRPGAPADEEKGLSRRSFFVQGAAAGVMGAAALGTVGAA